ncbi:hypothetical protein [Leptospira idonii]|uniref:Uncharacterized protein n=1 Tax=Leptospira idonii TaxID=1193500 RepID=A0A4R9M5G8_9LEPT|nr:hypothetical protein [Leptospira idonii]TGN20947.1 hypothetical protein EHS15_00035 [Leptospira idonii]
MKYFLSLLSFVILFSFIQTQLMGQNKKNEKEFLEKAVLAFLDLENFDFKSLSSEEIKEGEKTPKFQEKLNAAQKSVDELNSIRESLKSPMKQKFGPRFYNVPDLYWELKDVMEKQSYHITLIKESNGEGSEKESSAEVLRLYQFPAVGFAPPGAFVDVYVDNEWKAGTVKERDTIGKANVFLNGYGYQTTVPDTSIAKYKYYTENQTIKKMTFKYDNAKEQTQKKCHTFTKQLDCMSQSPWCLWTSNQLCKANTN